MDEQWRRIRGFTYSVSNRGRVRNDRKVLRGLDGILKQATNNFGYKQIALSRNGAVSRFLVHRLVLAAFVCSCPEGKQANHLDSDKTNNRLDNLKWVTAKQNVRHAKMRSGGRIGCQKLTLQQVRRIREIDRSRSAYSMSLEFGVTPATIKNVLMYRTWQDV